MFKLYGYRGFVVKGKADIGEKVFVKVLGMKLGKIENSLKQK